MKNIILGLGLLIVVGAGIFIYTQSDSTELDLNGGMAVSATVLARTQLYIERSATLNSISLDTEVLSDPRLNALRSYSQPVEEYSVGRSNPFEAPTVKRGP